MYQLKKDVLKLLPLTVLIIIVTHLQISSQVRGGPPNIRSSFQNGVHKTPDGHHKLPSQLQQLGQQKTTLAKEAQFILWQAGKTLMATSSICIRFNDRGYVVFPEIVSYKKICHD